MKVKALVVFLINITILNGMWSKTLNKTQKILKRGVKLKTRHLN